ncbi:MAG: histidine triad nucleotide-binding protein [Alphaproteobacteria bacterium]|nr:histidine triad nucleotide-binding protein [Alphaproteobacteria bacterium]
MAYDFNNVFAKIIRGEIPCSKVYEDSFALAFHDINPKAPVHILIIPKGAYETYDAFASTAGDAEIAGFTRALAKVIAQAGLEGGYRLITNAGPHSHQEVPHYHIHLLGGRDLGAPLLG